MLCSTGAASSSVPTHPAPKTNGKSSSVSVSMLSQCVHCLADFQGGGAGSSCSASICSPVRWKTNAGSVCPQWSEGCRDVCDKGVTVQTTGWCVLIGILVLLSGFHTIKWSFLYIACKSYTLHFNINQSSLVSSCCRPSFQCRSFFF